MRDCLHWVLLSGEIVLIVNWFIKTLAWGPELNRIRESNKQYKQASKGVCVRFFLLLTVDEM